MLQFPNFGPITKFTTHFDLPDQIFFSDVMDRNYVIHFMTLRRRRVPNIADIIKFATIFIKAIFKNSKKLKELEYVLEWNLYLYFLIWKKLLVSGEKMLMLPELKRCVTWVICFLIFLQVRQTCTRCHPCGICLIDFRYGVPFCRLSLSTSENVRHE